MQLVLDNHFHCGGSIIDPLTILTAAHCTVDAADDPSRYSIASGLTTRFENNRREIQERHAVPVADIFMKNHWRRNGDIAIIKLARPLELGGNRAASIDLYQHNDFDSFLDEGLRCKVAGWGKLYSGQKDPTRELREVRVEIATKEACSTYLRSHNTGPGE